MAVPLRKKKYDEDALKLGKLIAEAAVAKDGAKKEYVELREVETVQDPLKKLAISFRNVSLNFLLISPGSQLAVCASIVSSSDQYGFRRTGTC